MDLNILWFGLLAVLLTGYAILDGFDLGVGIMHLFVKGDESRRISLNSIGPLWDGNEVWLVTFGGALFAAFPEAYATLFSAFYLPFMALVFALIFRAVSIEFRSKHAARAWRGAWDFGFCGASALATFLFGVATGNAMLGLPLDNKGVFVGSLVDMLNPYAICVGALAVALFAMHGTIYLYLKTEGDLQKAIYNRMWATFGTFVTFYMLTTIFTLVEVPRATANFKAYPWAWIVVVLNVLAIANIPRSIFRNKPAHAFASSCCTVAAFVFLLCVALFPNLVTSLPNEAHSLTVYNSASSQKTLGIMAIIALIGMPCVLTYTFIVYRTFHGKVRLDDSSY
ncbi:MAG TPA: cytochrome d ubiquinol oxidase subunit II [Phycisphaerae bacterium]|nr:cytochrome d ubiquinol oxidase subunit II [Phycisphaerales bacterium]HRX87212.1 cytochrome d ubiquinol oxidase subunit II [Phycisphaerae bacterium]